MPKSARALVVVAAATVGKSLAAKGGEGLGDVAHVARLGARRLELVQADRGSIGLQDHPVQGRARRHAPHPLRVRAA